MHLRRVFVRFKRFFAAFRVRGKSECELSGAGLHGGGAVLEGVADDGEDAGAERGVVLGEVDEGLHGQGAVEAGGVAETLEHEVDGEGFIGAL
jgi:hypothetical protein